jgi:exodeoxyribonuclease V beta subunit
MSPSQALPTHELDPLRMRLSGVQLIEASAGTGKTWTLAALYVRLVLGHGCADGPARQGLVPPQILVMTFTEAATAELRGRIRARLAQAARCFEQDPDSDASAKEDLDDFLQHLRASYPPAQWPACAQRLNLAAQWMDDAAIFTIHGWSSRMLGTHAFDSAHLFQQSRVEDGEQLKRQAAQDYWRRWYYAAPLAQLPLIEQLASSPERLVDALSTWWRAQEHAPDGRVVAAEAPPALLARSSGSTSSKRSP